VRVIHNIGPFRSRSGLLNFQLLAPLELQRVHFRLQEKIHAPFIRSCLR
jgi:hypothetical protein